MAISSNVVVLAAAIRYHELKSAPSAVASLPPIMAESPNSHTMSHTHVVNQEPLLGQKQTVGQQPMSLHNQNRQERPHPNAITQSAHTCIATAHNSMSLSMSTMRPDCDSSCIVGPASDTMCWYWNGCPGSPLSACQPHHSCAAPSVRNTRCKDSEGRFTGKREEERH